MPSSGLTLSEFSGDTQRRWAHRKGRALRDQSRGLASATPDSHARGSRVNASGQLEVVLSFVVRR